MYVTRIYKLVVPYIIDPLFLSQILITELLILFLHLSDIYKLFILN